LSLILTHFIQDAQKILTVIFKAVDWSKPNVDESKLATSENKKWLENLTKNAKRLTPRTPEGVEKQKFNFQSPRSPVDTVTIKNRSRKNARSENGSSKTGNDEECEKKSEMTGLDKMLSNLSISDMNSLTEFAFGEREENKFKKMEKTKFKRASLSEKPDESIKIKNLSDEGKCFSSKDFDVLLQKVENDVQDLRVNNMALTDECVDLLYLRATSLPQLQKLNISNNKLSERGITTVLKIASENGLTELRMSNQSYTIGIRTEREIVDCVQTSSLKKLSFNWRSTSLQQAAEKALLHRIRN